MRLHFQSMGSGEPLVVLHGLFGSGDNWLSFAQRFAVRFRVILPDAHKVLYNFSTFRWSNICQARNRALGDDVLAGAAYPGN